jgi:KDO2-lipid IV(A) lauroyltransferase
MDRPDWLNRLQFAALRFFHMTIQCYPVAAVLKAAQIGGNLMYVFDRRHRERCEGNLRRSFPEMSNREVRRMARRSMQELFMLGCEVLFTPKLINLETVAHRITLNGISPVLQMILKRDHGVIMLTGHYGNWEILGYALATLGFETVSVARPLDNPYINEFLMGVRQRKGQTIVDKKGAGPVINEVLTNNGVVGIVADQNAGAKGMFVDFFNRKASTYKIIGLLAMQYNVPIVVGYARRVDDRFFFELGVQDIIWPKDWADQQDPLRYITQRYTKAIEDFIRVDPGQYLWVHRRWKTRPKGEQPEKWDL